MSKVNNLIDVVKAFPDEKTCREHLENLRWNDGKIVCQKCGSNEKIYKINDGKLYKCSKCRKQFTIKVGTIFEDSTLTLQKWFMAIYLVTAHKKGISSLQLSRDIDVTQTTAWFMLHRIRYMIKTKSFNKPLEGIVEADETYVGGKIKNKHKWQRAAIINKTSPLIKTAVIGMVERGGNVITEVVKDVRRDTVIPIVNDNLKDGSTLVTDSSHLYTPLKALYDHHSVNHEQGSYSDGIYNTNTIEGYWSLLKRGIYGIYHYVSPKHLHRYCDEFSYRYNTRKVLDVDGFDITLSNISGRLTYKQLKENKA